MENLGYLLAAYAVVWIGLGVYVAWLGAQLGSLRRDIVGLRDLLERAERGDDE
jgi:CcmD family protein